MVSSRSPGLTGNNNNNDDTTIHHQQHQQHDRLSPTETPSSSSCPTVIARASADIELRVNDKDALSSSSFGTNAENERRISSSNTESRSENHRRRAKELPKSQSGPSSLQSTSNYTAANFLVDNLISPADSSPNSDSSESSSILDDNKVESGVTNERYSEGPGEENYEGFGYIQIGGGGDLGLDVDVPGGGGGDRDESLAGGGIGSGGGSSGDGGARSISSAPSPTGPNSLSLKFTSPSSSIGRHSWLRTSLRRTPPSSGRQRQLGSNALASQLYRSGSFNSSGRGSTCDAADDMYSDVSLEDDVIDLNHRVRMIQEQMHVLTDTHSVGEERYARVKQENATLQARILMLEEAAKDAEARAEEKLEMEQRRHREWACRLEREKQLQLENYAIKMQTIELESASLRDQIGRLREQLDSTREDRARLDNVILELGREIADVREAERNALLRANEARVLLDAAKEELSLRADERLKIDDLVQEIGRLRERNKALEESRDELQAAAALHAGRELLMLNLARPGYDTGANVTADEADAASRDGTNPSAGACSLAVELSGDLRNSVSRVAKQPLTMSEMRQALKEQQEVNAQLRSYIDGILLNIVENYPQLLEVKQQANGVGGGGGVGGFC